MAKSSKVVVNRISVTETVASSLRVHGKEIAAGLREALGGSGSKLDPKELLSQLEKAIEKAAQELSAADAAHSTELSDDDEPRQERDSLTVAVRDKLLGLRDLLTGAYGSQVAAAYYLSESLPDNPAQVLQRGRNVEKLLREKPIEAPPRHASLKIKAADLADELGTQLNELEKAIKDVRREEREAQATLERKNRAGENWERVYLGVTHLAYGAYILAGRRDLAERIEPTVRRRAGLEDSSPTPPAPSPDQPAAPR